MSFIEVKHINKTFKVPLKGEGKFGAIKAFFKRKYKIIKAVNNISFDIKKGEIVGYIGPNGAGKSTTIKMLAGILTPDEGEIIINNMNPTKNRVKYCAFMRVRIKDSDKWGLTIGGSNAAQYKLANDFDDIYMGSTLTEFLNSSDSSQKVTLDISNYKVMDEAQYSSIISGNQLTEKQRNIHAGPHYSCLGFNILGADAAYNMINALYAPKDNATLVDAKGNRLANVAFGGSTNVKASDIKGNLYAYMDVGSSGKAVTVSVYSGSSDITSSVVTSSYLFDSSKVKAASDVKIVVKTADGKTATFNIVS